MAKKDSFLFRLCRSNETVREARVNTFYSNELFVIAQTVFPATILRNGDMVLVKKVTNMPIEIANQNNGFVPVADLIDVSTQNWKNVSP